MQSEFRCPHCGHHQVEPTRLISTFCRACGRYYSVGDPVAIPTKGPRKKNIESRSLTCHRCGQHQRISAHAQVTLCPRCNASIDLTDVLIAKSTAQEVDTRGQLTVVPNAHLEGGFSVCGSAIIKGKVSGILVCEQTARLFGGGRFTARLQAKRVVIEPEADLCFHFPLYTEELVIYGQLTATILCRGTVHIHRYGCLEGSVRARGMRVAKYGIYLGNLRTSWDEPKEAPDIPLKEFPELKLKRRRPIGESPI